MVLKKDTMNSSGKQLTEEENRRKQSKGSVSYEQLKGDILHMALNEKATVKDTSKKLGIAVTTVHKYVRQLKEEGKLPRDFLFATSYSKEDVEDKLLALILKDKYSANEIATSLNISITTVYKYVKNLITKEKLPDNFSFVASANLQQKNELEDKVYALAVVDKRSAKEIAKELKIAVPTVYEHIEKMKEKGRVKQDFSFTPKTRKRSGRLSAPSREKSKNKVLSIISTNQREAREIANQLGVDVATVYSYVTDLKKEGKLPKDFSFVSLYSDRDTENNILSLVNSKNYDAKSVADILGISLPTVYHHVRSLKNQGKVPEDFSFISSVSKEELKSKVYTLIFEERKTVKDIADELGVSDRTVYNYIEELKKEDRIPKEFSLISAMSKEKTKENICFLLLVEDKTVMDVSSELGIGYTTVYKYINELKDEGRLSQDFGVVKKSKEEAKEQVRKLSLQSRIKLKDIANRLDLNELTIQRYINELKDEGKIPHDFTFKGSTFNKEKDKIRQLALQENIRLKDIACELGVTTATARTYSKKLKEEGLLEQDFSFKRGRRNNKNN